MIIFSPPQDNYSNDRANDPRHDIRIEPNDDPQRNLPRLEGNSLDLESRSRANKSLEMFFARLIWESVASARRPQYSSCVGEVLLDEDTVAGITTRLVNSWVGIIASTILVVIDGKRDG